MKTNPLIELNRIGQSVWLDNLSRKLIQSGQLKRFIEEDGVTGITSNPSIFQKAISGSADYDASLRRLLDRGVRREKDLFFGLALEDIALAAEMLWPTYQATRGLDGYVSLEVSPDLADDTQATVAEAKTLFSTIGKKNILIKVPATRAGIPAIETLIGDGVNVNVTLLFAVERYAEVTEAYLKGLERRARAGQPLGDVASVASFFVSRVDTLTDKLLQDRLKGTNAEVQESTIRRLLGAAAVANATLAFRHYGTVFASPRFHALKERGATVQRLLWGSTGTKNPGYSDIKYVQELIGPGTINTLPEATMAAFKDHGQAKITLLDRVDEARKAFQDIESVGIPLKDVTAQLEQEGVKLFADSYFQLLKELATKRDSLLSKE